MFNSMSVCSQHGEYKVSFAPFEEILSSEISPGDVLLVDENVLGLYPAIYDCVRGIDKIVVRPGESAKEYHVIGEVIEKILAFGFSRNNRLIAIGGGVTQDITGFIAGILFRGVTWFFFPTNLLSQCDSCIGSKTSVNFNDLKNQLGSFYPPAHIIIDFRFLNTLEKKEILSGIGEMLHYFLVDGQDELDKIEDDVRMAVVSCRELPKLIFKSLSIKRQMVEVDEFDRGPRNIFNYGHSFGHALETVSHYSVPHGIAVSYGMDLANLFSAKKGYITMSLRNRIRRILAHVWAETTLNLVDADDYLAALRKDKKNIDQQIKVILTRGLGCMFKDTLEPDLATRDLISGYFRHKLYETDL
ncbi:MAG: 3-dehydroquinate synthase [Hahellaceae bacterium]|nr:3-dehydroquinate synthase [Hahellaceae bacterium]